MNYYLIQWIIQRPMYLNPIRETTRLASLEVGGGSAGAKG